MIIVCTKDPTVVDWTTDPHSGANQWGNVWPIPVVVDQDRATELLGNVLQLLGLNEPLCLTAHGNDTEMGDSGTGPYEGWEWNVNTIAGLLIDNVPYGYDGPILIRICGNNIANFSARLALSLKNGEGLNGVWIYGYNRPVPIKQTFPDPAKLAKMVDLQGSQVTFS